MSLIKRVLRTAILIILGALPGMLLGVLVVQIAFAATGRIAGNTNVAIAGFAYSPRQVTVRVGDTVTWTNNDSAPHTVTANDASFDSGTLGQGGVYSRTFGATGVFSYFCAIHPSMVGSVRVISEALVYLPIAQKAR
ncbi:MAG: cupredoxin family copper-binding protein [Anaerolineae bacterium]|nr:cupredoxin family copper-binding protein [Candidatus Roseilinea sp.]MDW8449574.1 cupredoxin family copper-binding protein [Anaerolineae bacterium]